MTWLMVVLALGLVMIVVGVAVTMLWLILAGLVLMVGTVLYAAITSR